MRIVHFYPAYLGGGGIAISIDELAAAQRAAGHEVAIVAAPHAGAALYGGIDVDAVLEIPVRRIDLGARPARFFHRGELRRALDGDVVHAHGMINPEHLNLLLRRAGRALVVSPHGGLAGLSGRGTRPALARAYVSMERLALWRGATAHALTPLEADDIARRLPKSPSYLAPNGVSVVEPVAPREHRASPLRLLAIGRLDIQVKGLDLLLSALARRGLEDVELDLVGPDLTGEGVLLRRQAESLGLSGRVRFVGMIGREQLGPYFAAADCFIQPSRREAASTALAEAILRGLPVIVSDRNGLISYEELSSQRNVVVTPTTIEGIAAAILDVRSSVVAMSHEAIDNRQQNALFFSWERVARCHVEAYSAAVA